MEQCRNLHEGEGGCKDQYGMYNCCVQWAIWEREATDDECRGGDEFCKDEKYRERWMK